MSVVTGSGIAASRRALTALYNSTVVRGTLNSYGYQFEQMACRKAFYYWFLYEGMEEAEFDEAIDRFKVLMEDYESVSDLFLMFKIGLKRTP